MSVKKTYWEKLKSPKWQKRRLEILQRDDFTCQLCFDKETTLHIHHKYYLKNAEPWDYADECLVTLCEDCHETETATMKDMERVFLDTFKKAGFFADDIREIGSGLLNMKLQHSPDVVASAYCYAFRDPSMQAAIIENYFQLLEAGRKKREQNERKD